MFKRRQVIPECVECGSQAVVITDGALVTCGECESPRGTYPEFFEAIRAAALREISHAPYNDNPQQSSPD